MIKRNVNLIKQIIHFSVITMTLMLTSLSVNASCSGTMGRVVTGYDYHTASLGVGRINIISAYLQPIGSVLAVGLSNYNTINSGGLANKGDEDIILTCKKTVDKNTLAWAFATNGDSRVGGFYEIPGFPGYYATQFPYVAIKLTLADTGEVFSRTWQKSAVKVQTEDLPNGGFVVKKKHLPKVIATLVKWPGAYGETIDNNGVKVRNSFCALGSSNETSIPIAQTNNPNQIWSSDYYAVNGLSRGCGQPSGYINLLGTGGYVVGVGSDSNSNYWAWEFSVPVGLNGNPAATFSYTPTCVVRTSTAYVLFPVMTVNQLESGQTAERNFDVTLECDNTINKAISTSSVAVGLQPSLSSFNVARQMGYIDNTTGGVTHLIDDNYGTNGVAGNVGVTLKNANGNKVNFVSWEGCIPTNSSSSSFCPQYSSLTQMRAAGWDPVMSGSTQITANSSTATVTYRKTYIATFGKIDGMPVTPGKFRATATVLVRLP